MKKLYIRILVQEGEREHTHHCLAQTEQDDIQAFADMYAKTFWGNEEDEEVTKIGDYWESNGGEIGIMYETVKVLTEEEWTILDNILYGAHD